MTSLAELKAERERRSSGVNSLDQLIAEKKRRIQAKQVGDQRSASEMTNEGIGVLEAGAISAGRGLTKIGRAVGLEGDIGGFNFDPEPQAATEAFAGVKKEFPIATMGGELIGETAPFIPAALAVGSIASTPLRVAATAALGAAEGGLIARGEGRTTGEQVGSAGLGGIIAGSLELVLPHISRIGGPIIRRILGKEPTKAIVDAAGKPSDEFIEALKKDGTSFEEVVQKAESELATDFKDPKQVARKAFLESQGVDATKAQISRTADDFQLQQEAAKTSGRVRAALEKQDAALTTRFDNKVLETGGKASTPTSSVSDALVNKATVLDQEIGDLYEAARAIAPGTKNVRFNALTRTLKKLKPSDRRAGGNVSALIGELKAKGIVDNDLNVIGKASVEEAEEIRIVANQMFDEKNGFGNIVLRQLKDKLDDDVFKSTSMDLFESARGAKAKFEQDLTRAKVSKFDSRKQNLVRDILEDKVNPDTFVDKIVFSKTRRAADLQQLKDYITTKDIDGLPFGDELGESAWNDLRAETLDTIKNKSFIGPEDGDGMKALSRDKLEKALDAIGPAKLKVLFTKEENDFLKDMLQVAKLREPVRGTQQGKGPSAQAIIQGLAGFEQRLKLLPLLSNLVEFVNIDAAGRTVLRAKPERLKTINPSEARGALSQAAAIVGVSALPEDQ